MSSLPLNIIANIAAVNAATYHGLALAHPEFGRSLTLEKRVEFAEKFGRDRHTCRNTASWHISESNDPDNDTVQVWKENNEPHRIGGPAIGPNGELRWYKIA